MCWGLGGDHTFHGITDIPAQFFSSYERLLLAKDGSCPMQACHQQRKVQRTHGSSTRSLSHSASCFLDRELSSPKALRTRLRKRLQANASQVTPLFGTTDGTFYESLPIVLKGKLFSPEERVLLANQNSIIVDSADEVLYRRSHQIHTLQSALQSGESLLEFHDLDSIEEAFLDSDMTTNPGTFDDFRWPETAEEELDLRLDDYHTALTQTSTNAQVPKRKPFRRNMSFSTITIPRRRSDSDQNTISANTRHSSLSSKAPPVPNLLESRKHRSQISVSSIDPSAKYYQDPEARLKLRVYLASPQKFDEAVEFGFPSLSEAGKKDLRIQTDTRLTQKSGRTFSTNDTPSLSEGDDDDKDDTDNPDTPRDGEFRIRPQLRMEPYASTNNREMTMKMTLTRPDLRSADEMKLAMKINELPLEQEALPYDGSHSIWDTLPENSSVVKKLWKRLRSL